MMYGKSGKGLCPVSFGLAFGITAAIMYFIWALWIMYHGVPRVLEEEHLVTVTLGGNIINALWVLLKGFIFGFIAALIYDCISCWCKCKCCRRCSCGCEKCAEGNCDCKSCGCNSCSCGSGTGTKKIR